MHFETLAIAALRAGEHEIGRDLVEQARAAPREQIPDEHVELAIAAALLPAQEQRWPDALRASSARCRWSVPTTPTPPRA